MSSIFATLVRCCCAAAGLWLQRVAGRGSQMAAAGSRMGSAAHLSAHRAAPSRLPRCRPLQGTVMPVTTFAQNNGVISLTAVASRGAGWACAIWLLGMVRDWRRWSGRACHSCGGSLPVPNLCAPLRLPPAGCLRQVRRPHHYDTGLRVWRDDDLPGERSFCCGADDMRPCPTCAAPRHDVSPAPPSLTRCSLPTSFPHLKEGQQP